QLAGGILEAVHGRRRRAVLTTGHGERVPSGDAQGITRLLAGLDEQGMTVDVVNLLDSPLPAETDLVIVAGPKRDFLPEELQPLVRHLEAGRGVLMLLDPGTLPKLQAFLGNMGLALGEHG